MSLIPKIHATFPTRKRINPLLQFDSKQSESQARASLATPCRLTYLSCLTCSGEACPRLALQRPLLHSCTYFNGICRLPPPTQGEAVASGRSGLCSTARSPSL